VMKARARLWEVPVLVPNLSRPDDPLRVAPGIGEDGEHRGWRGVDVNPVAGHVGIYPLGAYSNSNSG